MGEKSKLQKYLYIFENISFLKYFVAIEGTEKKKALFVTPRKINKRKNRYFRTEHYSVT